MVGWRIWILVLFSAVAGEDCVWDKDREFPVNPSLIMDLVSWTSVLPFRSGYLRTVRLSRGARVVIACPGTLVTSLGTGVAEGVCLGGKFLQINGQNFTMNQLGCTKAVKETLKKEGLCGSGQGQEYKIGFHIQGYNFYTLIDLCFDMTKETTLYAHHILRGDYVSGKDLSNDRPDFRRGGVFTVSPSKCYTTASQTILFENLGLNSALNGTYVSRGHLSPDADFLTEMEADATYYYVNAVPQWQSINNGNWKRLENAIRNLADAQETDLDIWTGTSGVLGIEDQNSNNVDLYLGLTKSKAVILVPTVVWKVIYRKETQSGIAVLSLNSPYNKNYTEGLCNYKTQNGSELCSQILWMNFNFSDTGKGRLYCCAVHELRNAIPYVPNLGTPQLLV